MLHASLVLLFLNLIVVRSRSCRRSNSSRPSRSLSSPSNGTMPALLADTECRRSRRLQPHRKDFSRNKDTSGVLEERDATYDVMLSQMVGRITSKPGGRPEMGEVVVVEKYNRPLPKLRSSNSAPGYHDDKPALVGTLNVAQLRQIIQLHEGKSEDHQGPMEIEAIAKKFRIDVAEVKTILQYVSLPPEDTNKKTEQDQ